MQGEKWTESAFQDYQNYSFKNNQILKFDLNIKYNYAQNSNQFSQKENKENKRL